MGSVRKLQVINENVYITGKNYIIKRETQTYMSHDFRVARTGQIS